MKTVGLYARVSTQGQQNEKTIDSQIAEIEQRAKQDGNIIDPNYKFSDDGWSGELLARPSLDALRDAIKNKSIDILYIYDLGRLSRNFLNQLILKKEISEADVQIISLHDINGQNPEDVLAQNVMGLFHDYERIKIAERFRRGKLFKAKSGILFGWQAPYGYKYIKGDKDKNTLPHFEIIQHEAEVVKLIFKLVAIDCLSIRKVIKRLQELKIPPRRNKDGVWSTSTLARLLRDETYIGTTYYNRRQAVIPKNPQNNNKYKKVKKTSVIIKPKQDWIPISVPQIIENNIFDQVQKQLLVNNQFSNRNKIHKYLLAGKIYCACGQKRTGGGTNNHIYYSCIDRILRFPLPRQCNSKGIQASVIDKLVWDKTVELLTQPKLVRKQFNKWQQNKSNVIEHNHQVNQSNTEELKQIEIQEKRFIEAYGSNIITLDQLKDNLNNLKLKKVPLKNTVKDQTVLYKQPYININQLNINELCDKMTEVLTDLTFEKKQFIIRKILDRVTTDNEQVIVKGYIPLQVVELNQADQNINLCAQSRNCRSAKCRKKHIV